MTRGLKKYVYQLLFGISLKEEYVCIEKGSIHKLLSVWLESGALNLDITDTHVFLGYKPVIMAIYLKPGSEVLEDVIRMNFCNTILTPGVKQTTHAKETIGQLILKRKEYFEIGENVVYMYEAIKANHRLISKGHQFLNNLYQKVVLKKRHNVNLNGNLYDQVRVAYSVSRTISLISLVNNNKMNLFPTDLHGALFGNFYLSSLRIDGKASEQVELTKKIVISEIETSQYIKAYSLGKNHMKDFAPIETFETLKKNSEVFNFPLPYGTTFYRELTVLKHFEIGIHRIYVYSIVNERKINDKEILTHVHAYYAQWLKDNSETPRLFLRNTNQVR